LNLWWGVFVESVLPALNDETRYRMGTQLIQKEKKGPTFTEQQLTQFSQSSHGGEPHQGGAQSGAQGGIVIGSDQHKNLWEHGQIEYVGRDKFENIQAHLDSQLHQQ